jgi:uncharacterized protein YecE (DUF72 family)
MIGSMAQLFAGTSGFAYAAWKPLFYPEKLAAKKFLGHYATRLNAVEVNYTFRRLPSASTLEGWLAETPPHFKFSLKAHQKITHFQRLTRSEFTAVFFKSMDVLRVQKRLGPVLFQLPPNLACDLAKFEDFLQDVPEDVPCAFEFRHKSWFTEEVYQLLEQRRLALCLAESDKLVVPDRVTADYVYFRLRKSEYAPEERQEIGRRAGELVGSGKDVFLYFKHEEDPAGALYAEELLHGQQHATGR